MSFPDYPFSSHFVEIQGHKLHYLNEGRPGADPVLMLHGNPTWSYYYRKLVLGLREQYHCIVPDHVGMGYSDRPREGEYDFMFTRRADDLAELLQALGIRDKLTLVLHDWGGMIGMRLASRWPECIRRLVILNTAAFRLPAGRKLPLPLVLGRIPLVNALLNQGLNAFSRGAARYCVTRRRMPPEVRDAYLAPYDSWGKRLAVRKFVEDIPLKPGQPGYDALLQVEEGLSRFRDVPMLICWGMRDFVFDETFLAEWTRRFPLAEVHRFEDAGHYVLEDAAAEIVPLAKSFLSRNPV